MEYSEVGKRKQIASERVVALFGRALAFPIEDDAALKEVEDACDRAEQEPDAAERLRIVNEVIGTSQVNRFIRRFTSLNDKLMPHGRWISPTYLVNCEVIEIETICEQMVSFETEGDDASAALCCENAMKRIARAAFHPAVRAFMSFRASRLPHLADVVHYLDSASILFYQQNYFAVANVLLPAIERLLVSITGFRLSDGGEAGTAEYRAALGGATMVATRPELRPRFEAHKAELLRFLFERFFVRSQKAREQKLYEESLLNRAFAFHLNEPGSYYTYQDCLTYFQVFDLFTEFVAAQHGKELPGLIPDRNPEVLKRSNVYWELILTDWLNENASPEKRVLEPTAFCVPESDHNYLALYQGPELKVLLVQAGLAVEGRERSATVNAERLALYSGALTMYHSVVGKP